MQIDILSWPQQKLLATIELDCVPATNDFIYINGKVHQVMYRRFDVDTTSYPDKVVAYKVLVKEPR